MAQIKFISECFVNPKYQLEASKQPYHLSPPDVAILSIDPIQKGLLFSLHNNPSSKPIPHFLESLKNSLSLALVHFYPLAGRFVLQKYPDEHACSISIDCSKGPGARIIHASSLNFSVSDINHPQMSQQLFVHSSTLVKKWSILMLIPSQYYQSK